MDGSMLQYPPGDPRLVDKIVCQLKSQGIFDRFRKECIADVDTKPAYQNLHQRVEGTVSAFLANQEWRPELNKNQLRDSLRKHIHESGILDLGVERIVDQVVNPKILPVLLPQIEDVVYNFLGIEKPKNRYSQTVASLQTPKNFKPLKMETLEDLLPKDLDPISPGSVGVNSDDENGIDDVKNEVKDEAMDEDDKMCEDEDSSPPFEPIEKITAHDESSLDSHISGISGLTSHDSQMSNLSYGKETRLPPEPKASHKIPPVDLSNQDSQLSKVSSGSRLSIVFSDDGEKSDQKNSPFNSDMDIQNDDSGLSKNGGVIEFESVAPQPPPPNEDSNSAYDNGIIKDNPTEVPFSCASPLEPLPDKLLIEDEEPVHEEQHKIDDVGDECSEVVKEPDIEEKYLENREKESEINDEGKHCNASSDSRDSKPSESIFHSSDSEQQKEEQERNHKNKENLKHEEKIDCKEKVLEDKQENEDVLQNDSEGLKKEVEDRDQSKPKMENTSEITNLEKPEDEEKNLKENELKEREFSKDKLKCDEKDFKEKIKNEDNEIKSEKDNKEEIKEKGEKERKANEDRGKENVKDKNKETEREGGREKTEKESSKEKSRHEEKYRDSSRDKPKISDKESSREKQKVDVKTDKDSHKDKPKTDDRSRKDVSKDKARHERSDKGSSRDSSRHKEQERSRSKNEGKDKKDEKSKEDRSKRNEKEATKEKTKKDITEATKNDDGEDKRNKSQNDQKREKDRSKETSRHSDKSKSDKGKGDDKVKEVKPETRDGVSKHESKGSEKTSKDSRSKSRTENKEKEDRSEKKESRKDERNRDKTKEDRIDKDKPKDDKKDKDKSREDKVDRDRSRSDKEKSKDNKSEREKPKDEKEKDRSSRSSHSSKDGENSKKTDRESSSKSRSSSSTSGASDKSRDSRKKEKEKSRTIPDDHSSHRDRNSDDRRSTDRDSNGQSAASRNDAPASRRNERSGVDDGGNNTSSKSDSGGGGSGGNGGGNESTDTTVAATPTKKESTDARDTPSDEGVAPSLPFRKRPVVSSPEPNESAAPDEYDCVNNASGKLVLKLKKPKIAANVFEVRKIMHLRKSMAKNEKKKLDDACEDQVDESSGDEPELKFFTDEEARPDTAFMKFVNDLEKSGTLFELAASDEEEMPEHTKAKRAREEPSTSGDTATPVPSLSKVDTDNARENIGTIGKAKTDISSGIKESPASSVQVPAPRAKSGAAAIEKREKRRRDTRRDTGKDIRTRNTNPTDQETPASPETVSQTPVGENLPSHISDVLGIDSGPCVNISKDSSPVSEEESRVKNVIRSSTVSSVAVTSPTVPCSPLSRGGRPPKRRASGISAPAVSEVTSVVAPKRLRNDTSSISDQVPSVVAVDIVKTIETTASRIIYPTTTTSRPSTLGLRRVPTTRSLSPGIINYGGYIPKEIVEVKVLDVDGDDEYSSSIKENNNVDKSSSDDEKGCGDDMSLSKELISTALRDLMMESGLNLGESPAPSAPAPAVASKDETAAEGATSAPGRRGGGVKAVRGRRLGLSRPSRRSGSDSLSPQTSGEFVLSPARNRDNPEAKAAAAVGASAREAAGTGSGAGAGALPALAGSTPPTAGGRRQLR